MTKIRYDSPDGWSRRVSSSRFIQLVVREIPGIHVSDLAGRIRMIKGSAEPDQPRSFAGRVINMAVRSGMVRMEDNRLHLVEDQGEALPMDQEKES